MGRSAAMRSNSTFHRLEHPITYKFALSQHCIVTKCTRAGAADRMRAGNPLRAAAALDGLSSALPGFGEEDMHLRRRGAAVERPGPLRRRAVDEVDAGQAPAELVPVRQAE